VGPQKSGSVPFPSQGSGGRGNKNDEAVTGALGGSLEKNKNRRKEYKKHAKERKAKGREEENGSFTRLVTDLGAKLRGPWSITFKLSPKVKR